MAAPRVAMRNIKECLRLKFGMRSIDPIFN